MTILEAALRLWAKEAGVPVPVKELKFHPTRKWRFDYAWPERKLALEIDGGTWIAGRHTRGAGYQRDCDKYNAAILLGWRVLRCTTKDVQTGKVGELVKQALHG